MTITARVPALEDRRATLRWLGRQWDGLDRAVREIMLAATVHESMNDHPLPLDCTCSICLRCTFGEYRDELTLADGAEDGTVTWSEIDPDLTCPDRTEAGRDEIWSRVAGLEDVLLLGVTARGHKAVPAAPREAGQAA